MWLALSCGLVGALSGFLVGVLFHQSAPHRRLHAHRELQDIVREMARITTRVEVVESSLIRLWKSRQDK